MWYLTLVTLFHVGDCAYIQEDKTQFPKDYAIRKIVDYNYVYDKYVYQIANKESDVKRHLFSYRDREEFEREEVKMECPKWFQ